MGVENPQQIAGYSLSSLDYTDFLRVVYDRPKNSVLPVSKTYKFPRVQQSVDSGTGNGGNDVRMTTSPALREVLDELRQIVDVKADQREVADAIREEIRRLEQDIELRMGHLRALIDKINAS